MLICFSHTLCIHRCSYKAQLISHRWALHGCDQRRPEPCCPVQTQQIPWDLQGPALVNTCLCWHTHTLNRCVLQHGDGEQLKEKCLVFCLKSGFGGKSYIRYRHIETWILLPFRVSNGHLSKGIKSVTLALITWHSYFWFEFFSLAASSSAALTQKYKLNNFPFIMSCSDFYFMPFLKNKFLFKLIHGVIPSKIPQQLRWWFDNQCRERCKIKNVISSFWKIW